MTEPLSIRAAQLRRDGEDLEIPEARVTTDEQIARVRELDAAAMPGPWEFAEVYGQDPQYRLVDEYRTLAPLLARKLERAMDALWYVRQEMVDIGPASAYAGRMFDEIEAME